MTQMARRIGEPKQELLIQDAVVALARDIFPPGRGRQSVVLTQVPSRCGRPDIIMMHVSRAALEKSVRNGIWFANETECRVAAAMLDLDQRAHGRTYESSNLGLSQPYVRRVASQLERRGLLELRKLFDGPPVVSKALIIEAKVRDWQKAFRQARAYRSMVSSVAVAMPNKVILRLDPAHAHRLEIGLLAVESGQVGWIKEPNSWELNRGSQLWLDELARRWWLDMLRRPEAV